MIISLHLKTFQIRLMYFDVINRQNIQILSVNSFFLHYKKRVLQLFLL